MKSTVTIITYKVSITVKVWHQRGEKKLGIPPLEVTRSL